MTDNAEWDLYREGHEYAVCDACGSHLLLDGLGEDWGPEPEPEPHTVLLALTCDWDPCLEDFAAEVVVPASDPEERNALCP